MMLLGLFHGHPAADHILADALELAHLFTDQAVEHVGLFNFSVGDLYRDSNGRPPFKP